jgi:hypothetical protein
LQSVRTFKMYGFQIWVCPIIESFMFRILRSKNINFKVHKIIDNKDFTSYRGNLEQLDDHFQRVKRSTGILSENKMYLFPWDNSP